jgi:hypothetical protein
MNNDIREMTVPADGYYPCRCSELDPNDPPCGSEDCGGSGAVEDWLQDEEQSQMEAGVPADEIDVRGTYGY